jgi:hypothetical protein
LLLWPVSYRATTIADSRSGTKEKGAPSAGGECCTDHSIKALGADEVVVMHKDGAGPTGASRSFGQKMPPDPNGPAALFVAAG